MLHGGVSWPAASLFPEPRGARSRQARRHHGRSERVREHWEGTMAQSTGAGDFRPLANMQSLSTVLAKPSARRTCQLIPATRSGGALLAGCGRKKMVPRGLEPRTLRLLAVRSNQLSYETVCFPFEQTTTLEPTSTWNRPKVCGTGDNQFFLHTSFFVPSLAYFTVCFNQSSGIMR